MLNVAVAGGTGNIGKTIVEVLAKNPENRVIIFSRKGPTKTDDSGVTIVPVDYEDVDSIKQALESYQVNTVVSCLAMTGEAKGQSETNLIKAAEASLVTKRFITNDWGVPVPEEEISALPIFEPQKAAIEQLRKTNLQWTTFFIGYIMDYFGLPYIKSCMLGPAPFVDVVNKVAAIPGLGNEPVTLTYSFDVAKFVDALLGDSEWPQYSYVIGDKLTWNDFVKYAEEARSCKFDVTYDSMEKLKTSQITELPAYQAAYAVYPQDQFQYFIAVVGRGMASGLYDLPYEKSLNAKFPYIDTLTAKEMLEQAWKGK